MEEKQIAEVLIVEQVADLENKEWYSLIRDIHFLGCPLIEGFIVTFLQKFRYTPRFTSGKVEILS